MASNTTYGDWMRPMPGGIRNIGKPLTILGLGVLVAALLATMANVIAGIAVLAVGMGVVAVLAVRDREHRNVLDRAAERAGWLGQSDSGRARYRSGLLSPVPGGQCRLPGILSTVALMEASDGFGRRFALICHRHTGEHALPLVCRPQGAALADDDVEDSYVAGWGGLLEALAVENGVSRIAVTVDTSPDSGVRFRRTLSRHMCQDAPELAARAMAQVMDMYAAGGAATNVILTLTFRLRDSKGRPVDDAEAARRIAQMIPNLQRMLLAAGGGESRCMTVDEITRMVRASYDPAVQEPLAESGDGAQVDWNDAGPVAAEAGWDHYRHDSGVSRTWEMCDPPKSNVTSGTIARLLAPSPDCDRKRVTMIFRVLPPDQTAFFTEQNRQKAANQVSQEKRASVSAVRQIGKTDRQAAAATNGAVVTWFGLLATATIAAGEDEAERLETASRSVEAAAGSAKIDLRICYGAQDTGFAASLPLGLDVDSYTPPNVMGVLL